MAREVLILNNPKVTLADTEAGLDAGDAFECQITSAALDPTATYNTVPATGCSGPTQSPGRSSWAFNVAWLQDWGADPSMSQYAFEHNTQPVWFKFTADAVQYPDLAATGQVYMAAGAYGGTFGDGSAAPASATWPCLAEPTIAAASTLAANDLAEAPLVDADA